MSDALADLERLIGGMSPSDKAELDKLLAKELAQKWLPTPGPQTDAYLSEADVLLYGGAAGGGKTDLLVGLALSEHQRVVIFRRAYGELSDIAERFLSVLGTRQGFASQPYPRYRAGDRLVEFGALEKPGSETAWRGRAHDLCLFDEGGELAEEKVSFVMGWVRSTNPKQRCRTVIASNPPTGGEGDWMLEWFAPWLDPLFAEPAAPGELRWAIRHDGKSIWKDGPGQTTIDGETYTHRSRTFVPAKLDDNPYLRDTGYRATLQNMPEPLRSQLLNGDFLAGREDHEWQVIPTSWVVAANERWKNAPAKKRRMIALAADIALGGGDDSALASLHEDCWFAPLITRKDLPAADLPAQLANWMLLYRRDGADLSADCTGGYGSGVRSHLKTAHQIDCEAIIFSEGAKTRTRDSTLAFKNVRTQLYWQLREALDPDEGDEVMLPPDPRLMAELTAHRYHIKGVTIQVEDKEDVKDRVGSSPDKSDAVVMAWYRRTASVKKERPKPPPPKGGGWMGR